MREKKALHLPATLEEEGAALGGILKMVACGGWAAKWREMTLYNTKLFPGGGGGERKAKTLATGGGGRRK